MPETKPSVSPASPEAVAKATQEEQAQIAAELEARPRDETIAGGKLIIGGVLCNAYGNPIHKDGTLINPDDAFKQSI